jgi:hypothetical protein
VVVDVVLGVVVVPMPVLVLVASLPPPPQAVMMRQHSEAAKEVVSDLWLVLKAVFLNAFMGFPVVLS